ncbi:MAG: hypothetical protein AAF616_14135, partial [Bacteroidota bacterium]
NNSLGRNVRATSDYWLEDGTYFRIRNITFGYTLPMNLVGKYVNRARFYVTATNPFTFTKYQGYDPEVGGDGLYSRGVDVSNYPMARRLVFGAQFSF